MHVLDSKVKFVSALGVHLLTRFWVCRQFSHDSRSYCLNLVGVGGRLLLILNLPNWFCRSSLILQAERGWAPFFFLVVQQGWGSVWATVITGAQFPAYALRALWGGTLRTEARPMVIIHLILQPFDQSVRCTGWERKCPHLPPSLLTWSLPVREVPARPQAHY